MELTTEQIIAIIRKGDSLFAYIVRERAISYLAGVCNYATTLDNQGYNGTDAGFGHSLADWISSSRKREGLRLSKGQDAAARKFLGKYVSRQIGPIFSDLIVGIDEFVLIENPETDVQFYAWLGICAQDQNNEELAKVHFAMAAQICKSCGISDETKRALWQAAKREHADGVDEAQRLARSEAGMDIEAALETQRDSPSDPRELAAIAQLEDAFAALA
jgi:hypothetical protein